MLWGPSAGDLDLSALKMWWSPAGVQGTRTGDFVHAAWQRSKWVQRIQPKPPGVSLRVCSPGSGQAAVCLVKDGVSTCRLNQTDRYEIAS